MSNARPVSSKPAAAAPGRARTTTRLPSGRWVSLVAIRWRSRRRTWLRCTADPTCRPTTNPARVLPAAGSGPSTWTTTGPAAALLPRRVIAVNSARCRTRESAGSTSRSRRSGREPSATLATSVADHRTPCPGTHPDAETVRLGALPVVGLERALHGGSPESRADVRPTPSRDVPRTADERVGCDRRASTNTTAAPRPRANLACAPARRANSESSRGRSPETAPTRRRYLWFQFSLRISLAAASRPALASRPTAEEAD